MTTLFSSPKVTMPTINPVSKPVSPQQAQVGQDDLIKRLRAMMGRSQTVLTGPLGEMNRKTVLGA